MGWWLVNEMERDSGHKIGVSSEFSVGSGLGKVEGCMVGKSGLTPAHLCDPGFCWRSGIDPRSVILEDFWLGTGVVMFLGHQMEVWLGGN